jgi:multiple sugar transport system permease protein
MYESGTTRIVRGVIVGVLIAVALVFFLFPIYWIFIGSFKSRVELTSPKPLHAFQFTPRLDNYAQIIGLAKSTSAVGGTTGEFMNRLRNSVIIAGVSTFLAILFGTMTAYAMARFAIPGKNDIMFYILSSRMLPPVVVIIPIFLMFTRLGLAQTYQGLILMYTIINLPFVVWMMKGFFDEIPHEYEDAAMLDGYPRIQAFFKVTLPQAWPGIAATAVFCLIIAWNEYVFAFILNSQAAVSTVPHYIASVAQGTGSTPWEALSAMATLFIIPVFVFTFLVRNHLLRGVTFGAVRR